MAKNSTVVVKRFDDGLLPKPLNNFYKVSGVRSDYYDDQPSLTRQEFKAECDINTIMDRYEKSGAFSHVNRAQPIYMDCTQFPDLRGAMDTMRVAGEAFAMLPAKVRREFDNDAQKFVDYARDPANLKQMREWGLADPEKPAPLPIEVKVVNPAPAPAPAPEAAAAAPGARPMPT